MDLDALIAAFEQHQRRTRGLREQTLHGYARFVRGLIREALGDDPIDVRRLAACPTSARYSNTHTRLQISAIVNSLIGRS